MTSSQRLQSKLGVGLLIVGDAVGAEDEVPGVLSLFNTGADGENSMSCAEGVGAVLPLPLPLPPFDGLKPIPPPGRNPVGSSAGSGSP